MLDNQFSILILLVFMMFRTDPFEKKDEVSEEELEFNSEYSYDYDTDSSNDE